MTQRFYTTTKLGPKRSKTPEGFLLCEEVPLARTGEMIYGPQEVPITPGPDGTITITRDEAEVFKPAFVLSLAGKPVCNDHPPLDVNPSNWCTYARGVGMNPRRGTGDLSEFLIGDLLITDASTIHDVVVNGKTEISLGYDAEYAETGPGRGRQYDMIANHIALVDNGRCGPVCSIRDCKGDSEMKTATRDDATVVRKAKVKSWYDGLSDRIRAAFKAKDEGKLEEALKDEMPDGLADDVADPDGGGDTHVHMHTGGSSSKFSDEDHEAYRIQNDSEHSEFRDAIEALKKHTGFPADDAASEENEQIEGALEEEAPPGTSDKARKAKDSSFLDQSFQEAVSGAEILAPGIGVPTYDKAAAPKLTLDAICGLRRKSLELAYATPEGRTMIESVNGGRPMTFDTLSCSAARTVFQATVAIKKAKNNAATTDLGTRRQASDVTVKSLTMSPAAINEMNRKAYGG